MIIEHFLSVGTPTTIGGFYMGIEHFLLMFLTIIGGVVVFVICEILKEIWLKPLQEYKQIKSRISFALVMYAHILNNPIDLNKYNRDNQHHREVLDKREYASNELRKISSELRSFIEILSVFRFNIPAREDLYMASKEIMGLANGVHYVGSNNPVMIATNNMQSIAIIKKKLKLFAYNKL